MLQSVVVEACPAQGDGHAASGGTKRVDSYPPFRVGHLDLQALTVNLHGPLYGLAQELDRGATASHHQV